jgi:hypothetical protein
MRELRRTILVRKFRGSEQRGFGHNIAFALSMYGVAFVDNGSEMYGVALRAIALHRSNMSEP